MNRLFLLIFFLPFVVHAQTNCKLHPVEFFKLPEGKSFGEAVGLAINSKQHVFVFHRGPGSLMEFDENGNFIRTIGDGFIKKAHGLRIDPFDNLWVTDLEQQLVMRFNPEGRNTLVLGKINTAGEWDNSYNIPLFNLPADVAFDSQMNIYVADGYGNSRIVKFDENGNFIKTWGVKGTGAGEFDLPHNIVIDYQDVVYVVDRNNKRIQRFNTEGDYIGEWNNIGNPFGLTMSKDNFFITDGKEGFVSILDKTGKVIAKYGQAGKAVAQFLMPHALAVSPDYKLFVAEGINWRVQCFLIPE